MDQHVCIGCLWTVQTVIRRLITGLLEATNSPSSTLTLGAYTWAFSYVTTCVEPNGFFYVAMNSLIHSSSSLQLIHQSVTGD